MNFCSRCGANTHYVVPDDDNRRRYVCRSCGAIHYQNPKIVCGCLVRSGEGVLLCKRAIEPRKGFWTFPAGFLERGESTQAGAERETLEEACAKVTIKSLYIQFDLVYISQIYQFFLADLQGSFAAGHESLDARLFTKTEIPWQRLAFAVVEQTLRYYFSDSKQGHYPHRHIVIPDRSYWQRVFD